MSVVAKIFTRSWLPRLIRKIAPNLPLEQGCGRKGQGSTEHLWAFLSMVEDCLEGRDNDSLPLKECYALFADIHKAFDQVWRDGLYCALYAQGVRGKMWNMIQSWLNGTRATTTWNGTHGLSLIHI